MARLFISYKREEQAYAFALRQWLMDIQGWASEDIFVDVGHLHAGVDWEARLLAEAEAAEAMLFLASDLSLDIRSFCYRELQHASGQILAVTIKGVAPEDERLMRAIPDRAKSRQITALDREPTRAFEFVSPLDNTGGSAQLNAEQVESIGATLRDLGIAPNSFSWTPTSAGPYPGLSPLREGDEALFHGRNIEIRDGLRALEVLRETVTQRALVIQAPSGAGKSSFLRAGLWRRLRRHAAFTPLGIVRPAQGLLTNETWGLAAGLYDTLSKSDKLAQHLNLSLGDIEAQTASDLMGLLAAFADADASEAGRRTLLIGIDQAEEISDLSEAEDAELTKLLSVLTSAPDDLPWRLVLTARDDSVDATLARLAQAGIAQHQVDSLRLHRLPTTRFDEIITGPAAAAKRAGWPLVIDDALTDALANAASRDAGDVGDALPILALALQRMVLKHRAPDGQITLAPTQASAFIDKAVADTTADAMEMAGADTDALRRLVIPKLATWDPQAGTDGAAKRQVASEAELFAGDRAPLRPLADALVEQRLLTRSTGETGAIYEVAHEALLRVPPLGDLIFERREKFVQAHMLRVEARDWASAGQSAARLARSGERLREAETLLADPDFGPDLARDDADVPAYLAACAQEEQAQAERERELKEAELAAAKERQAAAEAVARAAKRTTRQTMAGLVVALLLAAVAGVAGYLAFDAQQNAEEERNAALKTQSLFLANLSRQQIAGERADAGTALLLALEGLPDEARGPDGEKLADRPSVPETEFSLNRALGERLERMVVLGHTDNVNSVAFSLDGTRIITGSSDNTARIWDGATGEELIRLEGHTHSVYSAAFSPDGAHIVTGSLDTTARIWDAATGEELVRLEGHTGLVWSAAFSPDGKRIVTAAGGFTGDDNTARIWDAETGQEVTRLEGHTDGVSSAAFSPDGERIATASHDNTARIWDAQTGAELVRLEGHTHFVYSAAFSPDGARIVTASGDNTARIWNVETGEEVVRLEGHTGNVTSAAFSQDGARVVTGSGDHTARIWDPETGAELIRLEGHTDWVWSAVFSPDGARIVTGSKEDTARIWDAATGEELVRLEGHTDWIRSAAFSPAGVRIVTGSDDKTAQIWDAATGKELLRLEGHTGDVNSAAFSLNGERIVTGSDDNTARIWDAETGKELVRLEGHTYYVHSAAFSQDGARVVTGSWDETARIWDAKTGKEVARLEGHTSFVESAAFSPDGARIVTGSTDYTARIWDAKTGNELLRLEGHASPVESAAFSPDGTRIVTGSDDTTARIWDAETGKELARLEGHTYDVNSAAFSPDGARIVTGSADNTARIWDAATGQELIYKAKKLVPRCLTRQQREDAFLPQEPPRWCITGPGREAETDPSKWQPKWPYHTAEWRDWLAAKDRGEDPPLPTSEEP